MAVGAGWRWSEGSGAAPEGEKAARLTRAAITTALFVVLLFLIQAIGAVQGWPLANWALLALLVLDSHVDRRPGSWVHFLPRALAFLLFAYLLYYRGPGWWWSLCAWRNSTLAHLVEWNGMFRRIPFNDGAWLRPSWLQVPWFTSLMQWVYSHCFPFAAFAPMIRTVFTRDLRKLVSYALSTYVLQFVLIIPFYWLINLEEVWWVLGHPDPFSRDPNTPGLKLVVQNCFPSMHTSVAFAVLLLALRERGPVFKWVAVTYAGLIIYSTVFLEIHWLLDLAGGMLLAAGAVALSDRILARFMPQRVAERPAFAD